MKKQTIIIILVLLTACSGNAFAAEKGNSRRQGPPPEAYSACEGKKSGDSAEFTSPRGDTVTGTCEQNDNRLVLRPDRSSKGARKGNGDGSAGKKKSGKAGGRQQGPPPEAFTACEGKKSGDTAEFASPRGDTVTGTCEQHGDRLALRPDHPPEGSRGARSGKKRKNDR